MRKFSKKFFLLPYFFLNIFISNVSFANSDILKTYGNIAEYALPLTAVGMTYFHNDWEGFKEFSYALLATEATVQTLKYTVNRTRPNGGRHSFPSGHTAASFAGASFLQMRYGWRYGIPAYIAAALVGYSRIESKNHWTTDVLAGTAISIGFNLLFTKPYQNTVMISPYYDSDKKETGVQLSAKI